MIYLFDELQTFTETVRHEAYRLLPEQRLEKIGNYRFERDRDLGMITYLLLRYALREEYAIDKTVTFDHGPHGKPHLREYPDIHFSFSHCREGALCAVALSPVGADIQEIVTSYKKVMYRTMSDRENSMITEASRPDITFTAFWVLKEAYIKYRGTGLSEELRTLDFSQAVTDHRFRSCFCYHYHTPRYCYSCCSARPEEPAVIRLTVKHLLL